MATQQKERNAFGNRGTFGEGAKDTAEKAGEMAQDAATRAGDAAKDTAHKAGDMAKDAAGRVGDVAKDTASRAGEMVQDAAGRAGEFVRDAASNVAHRTSDAASYVAQKAEDATVAAGQNVKSFAGTIRDKGPHEGILGRADAAVADSLESCGREMEQGLSGMASDLTSTIRRHPVPAVLIGIGLGFLIARTLSSSR